jgi:hypothetical protein
MARSDFNNCVPVDSLRRRIAVLHRTFGELRDELGDDDLWVQLHRGSKRSHVPTTEYSAWQMSDLVALEPLENGH